MSEDVVKVPGQERYLSAPTIGARSITIRAGQRLKCQRRDGTVVDVSPAVLARGLIERAVLEHAVVHGGRRFCSCGRPIHRPKPSRRARSSGLCLRCNGLANAARSKEARARRRDQAAALELALPWTWPWVERPAVPVVAVGPLPGPLPTGPRCAADGCARSVLARGLCRVCYMAERRSKMPACSRPGCALPSHAKGLCLGCYVKQGLFIAGNAS